MANWWDEAQPAPAAPSAPPAPAGGGAKWWEVAKPMPEPSLGEKAAAIAKEKYAGQGPLGFGKAMAEVRGSYPQYPEVSTYAYDRMIDIAKNSGNNPISILQGGNLDYVPEAQRDEFTRMRNLDKGLSIAQDDQQRMDIIAKQMPGAKFQRGPEDSILVNWNGQTFYLNKPGTSGQDWAEASPLLLGGAAAAATGGGAGAALAGFGGRVVGTGLALGGQSVLQDLGARHYGSEQPVDWGRAGIQGGLGMAFEALAPFLGKSLQKLFPGGRGLIEGAKFSPKGEAWLRTLGIDPADMTPEGVAQFKALLGKTDDTAAAMRQAEARSLPVPDTLTTGQATQSPWLQTVESGFKSGPGGDVLLRKEQQQLATMADNKAAIQSQIGGALAPGQGAGNAREFLLAKMQGDKRTINQLYEAAKGKDASLGAPAVDDLGKQIRRTLAPEYDIAQMPALKSLLDGFSAAAPRQGATVTKVNLKALEQWRTRATNAAAGTANAAEAGAIRKAVKMLDDWFDTSLAGGAIAGDQGALQAWKDAIQARKDFGKLFERTDVVKRLVQQRPGGGGELKFDYDDAADVIFGGSSMGARKGLATDLDKLKAVLPAEEWSGLRQEAFLRLFRNQGTKFDGLRFAKELDNALIQSPQAMKILFSPDEIALMQQFKRYVTAVTSPYKIMAKVNTSGTAASNYFFRQFGSMGRAVQMFAQKFLAGASDTWNAPAAAKLARGLLPPRAGVVPPGVTGAAGAAAGQQLQ